MAYVKQTWQTGDIVTSAKLNHMEDGIANGGGVLIVNAREDAQTQAITLDKTWQEIYEAGYPVLKMSIEDPVLFASWLYVLRAAAPINPEGKYLVRGFDQEAGEEIDFLADSANDYPSSLGQ